MIHTPAEDRIRRALPAAARLAGITADARQLGILARAAAKAAQAPQERGRHSPPLTAARPAVAPFSTQEIRLLQMVADGVQVNEIAARLGVCRDGARSRIHRLLVRLGVQSRPAAVARGYELGLLGGGAR